MRCDVNVNANVMRCVMQSWVCLCRSDLQLALTRSPLSFDLKRQQSAERERERDGIENDTEFVIHVIGDDGIGKGFTVPSVGCRETQPER